MSKRHSFQTLGHNSTAVRQDLATREPQRLALPLLSVHLGQSEIVALQRTVGNQAVQRILRSRSEQKQSPQTKLPPPSRSLGALGPIQRNLQWGPLHKDKELFKRVVWEVIQSLDSQTRAFVQAIHHGDLSHNTHIKFQQAKLGSSLTNATGTVPARVDRNEPINFTITIAGNHLDSEIDMKTTLLHELTVHFNRFETLIRGLRNGGGEQASIRGNKALGPMIEHHQEFASGKNNRYLDTAAMLIFRSDSSQRKDLLKDIIDDIEDHYIRDVLQQNIEDSKWLEEENEDTRSEWKNNMVRAITDKAKSISQNMSKLKTDFEELVQKKDTKSIINIISSLKQQYNSTGLELIQRWIDQYYKQSQDLQELYASIYTDIDRFFGKNPLQVENIKWIREAFNEYESSSNIKYLLELKEMIEANYSDCPKLKGIYDYYLNLINEATA